MSIESYSVNKDSLIELCQDISIELIYQTLISELSLEQIEMGLSKALSNFLAKQPESDPIKSVAIEKIASQAKKEVLIQLDLIKNPELLGVDHG